MAIYADTPGSGQVLYGVNSRFKINVCGSSPQEVGEGNVLHLTRSKPELMIKTADFKAVYKGTVAEIGDFQYASDNGMLELENLEDSIGIEPDDIDTTEIPLGEAVDVEVALVNLHLEPELLPEVEE